MIPMTTSSSTNVNAWIGLRRITALVTKNPPQWFNPRRRNVQIGLARNRGRIGDRECFQDVRATVPDQGSLCRRGVGLLLVPSAGAKDPPVRRVGAGYRGDRIGIDRVTDRVEVRKVDFRIGG